MLVETTVSPSFNTTTACECDTTSLVCRPYHDRSQPRIRLGGAPASGRWARGWVRTDVSPSDAADSGSCVRRFQYWARGPELEISADTAIQQPLKLLSPKLLSPIAEEKEPTAEDIVNVLQIDGSAAAGHVIRWFDTSRRFQTISVVCWSRVGYQVFTEVSNHGQRIAWRACTQRFSCFHYGESAAAADSISDKWDCHRGRIQSLSLGGRSPYVKHLSPPLPSLLPSPVPSRSIILVNYNYN